MLTVQLPQSFPSTRRRTKEQLHGALGQLREEQKNVPDRFASIASSASSGWRRGGDRQVYLVTVNLQSVSSAYARDRPLQSTSPARRANLRTGSDHERATRPATICSRADRDARNGVAAPVAHAPARALPPLRRVYRGDAALPLRQHGRAADELQGSPRLLSLEEVRYRSMKSLVPVHHPLYLGIGQLKSF